MPRPCRVCASAANRKIVSELLATGATDQAIADKIGMSGDAGRMAVSRHRKAHIERPAKAIVEASNKGLAVRKERQELVAAAEAGDAAAAFIGLAAIVNDLKTTRDRLERVADGAEKDGQRAVIASIAAQQIKATEVRARLGGLQGYMPPKSVSVSVPAFTVNFNFSDGRRTQITAMASAPVLDLPAEMVVEDNDSDLG